MPRSIDVACSPCHDRPTPRLLPSCCSLRHLRIGHPSTGSSRVETLGVLLLDSLGVTKTFPFEGSSFLSACSSLKVYCLLKQRMRPSSSGGARLYSILFLPSSMYTFAVLRFRARLSLPLAAAISGPTIGSLLARERASENPSMAKVGVLSFGQLT